MHVMLFSTLMALQTEILSKETSNVFKRIFFLKSFNSMLYAIPNALLLEYLALQLLFFRSG